jgi:hypothetical protein
MIFPNPIITFFPHVCPTLPLFCLTLERSDQKLPLPAFVTLFNPPLFVDGLTSNKADPTKPGEWSILTPCKNQTVQNRGYSTEVNNYRAGVYQDRIIALPHGCPSL